jgi:hypothetical protein
MTQRRTSIRRAAVPAAFLGGGLLAGAVLTGALSASAATSPPAVPGAAASTVTGECGPAGHHGLGDDDRGQDDGTSGTPSSDT